MRNIIIGTLLISFTVKLAFSRDILVSEEKHTGLLLGVMQVTDQMSLQLVFEIIKEEQELYFA